jgi:hypothetical protein
MIKIETKEGSIERVIKVPWNQRSIDRMRRWFKLEYDFSGFILWNGFRVGYKTAGPALKNMYFHFYTKEKL